MTDSSRINLLIATEPLQNVYKRTNSYTRVPSMRKTAKYLAWLEIEVDVDLAVIGRMEQTERLLSLGSAIISGVATAEKHRLA